MTCQCNCNCNESCDNKDKIEYQEFIPNKEYPVGGFFKIGNEVFKVIKTDEDFGCSYCEFYSEEYDVQCRGSICADVFRTDKTPVAFILYDTLEDDE